MNLVIKIPALLQSEADFNTKQTAVAHTYKYYTELGTCECTLCSLTGTLNVHYENLQFDQVKGHVRDPSLNSVLLLTSSIYVRNFINLRHIVLELW